MPSPPKIFIHNTVLMATTRVEEGLPLVPTRFINAIIMSILAMAQEKYPVEVIGFVFQANHFHFILRVESPENVPLFIGYIKQEIAHRVNRLLGRRKRTIWANGYDSPTILDEEKTLDQIAYVMLNPVEDDVVEEMGLFPGMSSFGMFETGNYSHSFAYIPRDEVYALKHPDAPYREEQAMMRHFEVLAAQESAKTATFKLSPYAWCKCFAGTRELSEGEARERMQAALTKKRAEIEERRIKEKRTEFPDPKALTRQSMVRRYQPKSFGKRMLCLSRYKELRVEFIEMIKSAWKQARETVGEWGKGLFQNPFPPGFFVPGRAPVASLLWGVATG